MKTGPPKIHTDKRCIYVDYMFLMLLITYRDKILVSPFCKKLFLCVLLKPTKKEECVTVYCI